MDGVKCVTWFLQIFIFSTYAVNLDSSALNRTSKIYNPIVKLVNFPNYPCTGSATSLTGICYSSEECSNVGGGQADGKCAQGFGVCCVIRTSDCGGTVSQNSTHIQSPGYPDGYLDSTSCDYTFQKTSTDICAIRLDMEQFVIRGPALHVSPYTECSYDYMSFTNPSGATPPKICGYNTGHHLYIDNFSSSLTSNPTMTLTFTGTRFSRYWQIRVDQIPCGTLYTPPMGCVQYHMDNYGNFKSFNFGLDDDYHTLGDQTYSICIRRNSKMCRIAYNAADDGESFYMSQTPTVAKVRSRAGETGCPTDFISINDGSNAEANGGICTNSAQPGPDPTDSTYNQLGRYCGRRLNCYTNSAANSVIYSSVIPFVIQVDMNGAEQEDNKNRGFSINYRQIKC